MPQKPVELFLAVPPVWELSFQNLGIPTVAAYIRQCGFRIAGRAELNIGFQHYMVGRPELDLELMESEYQKLRAMPYYRENYEHQFDSFYSRMQLPFGYSELVSCNYENLLPFLQDERVNIPLRFFRERGIADELADASPGYTRVVGMGIDGENQLLGALTLAVEIKKRNPEVLIALGSNWMSAMIHILVEERDLLAPIDFLVPGKGEVPLRILLEQVQEAGGKPEGPLPGIRVNQGGVFTEPLDCDTRVPAAELPRPELFDLRLYGRPNVLPYESERGCYWGKCKFCHHIMHYTHAYNSKPIDKVISDLRAYEEEFPYKVVAFVDAAMPPRRAREIAERFLAEDMNKRWAAFCRIEKSFTRDILDLCSQSGLDVISYGVETASLRLSTFIGKPMHKEVAYRVMRDTAEAGIYTTAGIMNGLPSETHEELQELWDFLDSIKGFSYLHPHVFKFERGSEYFENAAMYNLEIIPAPPGMRLSPYRDFIDHNGGTTRPMLVDHSVNKRWWKSNMEGRSLDWKTQSGNFCKGVQVIVDK
jgi:radical SAM superfamily enzyme YgiQ (UPF0313 family)